MNANRNEMGFPEFQPEKQDAIDRSAMLGKVLIALLTVLFLSGAVIIKGCIEPRVVGAEEINLAVIAKIESGGFPLVVGGHGEIGLCQITKGVLTDFNKFTYANKKGSVSKWELFNPRINLIVASWYFNYEIPRLLKHYGIADTVNNRIIAWNAGINNARRGRIPKITKRYLAKYARLSR